MYISRLDVQILPCSDLGYLFVSPLSFRFLFLSYVIVLPVFSGAVMCNNFVAKSCHVASIVPMFTKFDQ
jgi:hypothetical protein